MKLKSLLKSSLLVIAALTLSMGFFIFGGYRFVKGGWLDRALSSCLSSRIGLKARLYDVNFSANPSAIRFGILSVMDPKENKILFVSGTGSARYLSGRIFGAGERRFKIRLEDAVIMEDLYRKSPLIDWASRQAFNRPISLKSIEALFKNSGTRTVARILSCRSDTLLIKGGVVFQGKNISKLHLLILLPEERFEKIPKEMRARMVRRKAGWRGIRLSFTNNTLTASGDSGPFFQAQWNYPTENKVSWDHGQG